jgi:hypothetical protein
MFKNTTGTQNTAIGKSAMENNETGNFNTSVGNQTLQERTLGSGEITTYNPLQIGGVIGIEPMIRISPSMHITASALYDLPFSSTLSDATLNISGFRGQIGLRYSIRMFAPSPNTP